MLNLAIPAIDSVIARMIPCRIIDELQALSEELPAVALIVTLPDITNEITGTDVYR